MVGYIAKFIFLIFLHLLNIFKYMHSQAHAHNSIHTHQRICLRIHSRTYTHSHTPRTNAHTIHNSHIYIYLRYTPWSLCFFLKDKLEWTQKQRAQGLDTVPSTIQQVCCYCNFFNYYYHFVICFFLLVIFLWLYLFFNVLCATIILTWALCVHTRHDV